MTLAPDRPVTARHDDELRLGQLLGDDNPVSAAGPGPAPDDHDEEAENTPISPGLVCLAAGLSAAAAGFVLGSLFIGTLPRIVGLLAPALGAVLVWLSFRGRHTTLVQLLVLPVTAGVGALLVMPEAKGGTANLPSLVLEALRAGGLGRPPVPFDPGWRFLLVVTIGMLAAAAAALSTGLDQPKIAVFLPLPVAFVALSATSSSASLVATFVPLVLVVAALAVSYGAQLAREGATSGRFEARRLVKGAATMAVLAAVLAALTQVSFLFPASGADAVIPPQPPKMPAPEPDRELFVTAGGPQVAWRVGVLDGYDGKQWLTPPYDPGRLVKVGGAGSLPPSDARGGAGPALHVHVTVSDIRGHLLPVPANPTAVRHGGFTLTFDPRTETIALPDKRASRGMSYTVDAVAPPQAKDLIAAPAPPPSMRQFLTAPPAPTEVADLLAQAPKTDAFTRLQYVRQRFYAKVVASGAGTPRPVPPARVVELLAGRPGSPYEITAAEALLARWVGVPSRLGFGYFGGTPGPHGTTSFRPKDGATWLEAYFSGQGWVPIVGTPPRAQSSLSSAPKNNRPSVRPSENLTLPAYVPVRETTIRLLYVLVQFWVLRTVPYLLVAGLVVWLYPGVLKAVRRARRARWARRGVPADRIRVTYANWRDLCHDLGVGHPALTPLEFVKRTEPDAEHNELGWLVTRCLWGDLSRDVQLSDVEAAEQMAASLRRRLRSVQPATSRITAFAARRSLRDPYSRELPNVWWPADPPHRRLARAARRTLARLRWSRLRPHAARPLPTTALIVLLAVLLGGCAQDVSLTSAASSPLPPRLVPSQLGQLTFEREVTSEAAFASAGSESLVGQARVFTVRQDKDVVAALQMAAFKTSVRSRLREVRAGIVDQLGGGQFRLTRLGSDLVYVAREPDRQLFLYFPPGGAYYELFIARTDFASAEQTLAGVIGYQTGRPPVAPVQPPLDPRRGFED